MYGTAFNFDVIEILGNFGGHLNEILKKLIEIIKTSIFRLKKVAD